METVVGFYKIGNFSIHKSKLNWGFLSFKCVRMVCVRRHSGITFICVFGMVAVCSHSRHQTQTAPFLCLKSDSELYREYQYYVQNRPIWARASNITLDIERKMRVYISGANTGFVHVGRNEPEWPVKFDTDQASKIRSHHNWQALRKTGKIRPIADKWYGNPILFVFGSTPWSPTY